MLRVQSAISPLPLALLLSVFGLAACDEDDGGGGGCADPSGTDDSPVDYEMEIQASIFNVRCSCHLQGQSGTMTAPFMTLNPGVSRGEIVDQPSMESELLRIEPGCRDNSYLWHKINGTHIDIGGSGDAMPPGDELSADEKELIGRWISSGAGA